MGNYKVEIAEKGGIRLVEIWRNQAGQLHAPLGQAAVKHWNEQGMLTTERFFVAGLLSRLDGPASVRYNNNEIIGEDWRLLGIPIWRENGPSRWEKDAKTGVVVRQEYWELGCRHRKEQPAVIIRDPGNGDVTRLKYYESGRLIRIENASPGNPLPDPALSGLAP